MVWEAEGRRGTRSWQLSGVPTTAYPALAAVTAAKRPRGRELRPSPGPRRYRACASPLRGGWVGSSEATPLPRPLAEAALRCACASPRLGWCAWLWGLIPSKALSRCVTTHAQVHGLGGRAWRLSRAVASLEAAACLRRL
jgi:hypothetical protein